MKLNWCFAYVITQARLRMLAAFHPLRTLFRWMVPSSDAHS